MEHHLLFLAAALCVSFPHSSSSTTSRSLGCSACGTSYTARIADTFDTVKFHSILAANNSDLEFPIRRASSLYSTPFRLSGLAGCGICGNSSKALIGDTLASIAQYCNVGLKPLMAANPGFLDSNITGKILRIPCEQNPVNCSICGSSHLVRQGDTLSKIANVCRIDLATMESVNPDIDYDNLVVDQYLTLPCGDSKALSSLQGCGPCGFAYSATGNQSIQDIASLCEVSAEELRATNPSLKNSESILPGQVVNLPCDGRFSMDCGLCGNNYTAVKTDDLTSVALKCRVGIIDLQLLNPGIIINSAIAGHVVHIPCQSTKSIADPICSSCSPFVQVLRNESRLADVASRCNISIDVLSFANSIPLSERVKEGQSLSVPCVKVSGPEQNCSICGSSIELNALIGIEKVVQACGLNGSQLKDINPRVDLSKLAPGDKLNLPCNNPNPNCGPCGIAYRVQVNETLQNVAVKCARAAADIQYLNQNSIHNGVIGTGSILTLPCLPRGTTSNAVRLRLVALEGPFPFLASLLYALSFSLCHFLFLSNWRTLEIYIQHG